MGRPLLCKWNQYETKKRRHFESAFSKCLMPPIFLAILSLVRIAHAPSRTLLTFRRLEGRKFHISALVKKQTKQFTIDFLAGADVAMRINPRLSSKVKLEFVRFGPTLKNRFQRVICNSRLDDTWGDEERLKPAPFLLKRKHTFDLLVSFHFRDEQFLAQFFRV